MAFVALFMAKYPSTISMALINEEQAAETVRQRAARALKWRCIMCAAVATVSWGGVSSGHDQVDFLYGEG